VKFKRLFFELAEIDLTKVQSGLSKVPSFGRCGMLCGANPAWYPCRSLSERAADTEYRDIDEFLPCHLCKMSGVPDSNGVIRLY